VILWLTAVAARTKHLSTQIQQLSEDASQCSRYISVPPLYEWYSYAEGAGKLACTLPNGTKRSWKTSNCCTNGSRSIRRMVASAPNKATILLTVRVHTTHLKDWFCEILPYSLFIQHLQGPKRTSACVVDDLNASEFSRSVSKS
jgi:hypothetical protein